MTHHNPDDAAMAALLGRVRTFAVVGASNNPDRPSYRVMQALIDHGYRVIPINPGLADKTILGQAVVARLADCPAPVDVLDIFRNSEAVPGLVAEAIEERDRLGLSVVWMQLDVISEEGAAAASAAGLTVVMDRCPKIELARLG